MKFVRIYADNCRHLASPPYLSLSCLTLPTFGIVNLLNSTPGTRTVLYILVIGNINAAVLVLVRKAPRNVPRDISRPSNMMRI